MLEWTEVSFVDDLKLRLVASDRGIRSIEFHPGQRPPRTRPRPKATAKDPGICNDANILLRKAAADLNQYFAGALRQFNLRLDMTGTEFQMAVWLELTRIPYGETRSYAQIATAIGAPKAIRAVGAANGANPVAIVVPCHRVIGSNGSLTGYGGGLALKKRLLQLEGVISQEFA